MSVASDSVDVNPTAELDDALALLHVEGHWKSNADGFPVEPGSPARPFLWRWADLYPHLVVAGKTVGNDIGASRRTLRLCNPGLAQKTTTRTIHASIQMVMPGEVAASHRHSIGAIRFVLEGTGGCTTVDGRSFVMEPHDLVVTPAGTWHGHTNESDAPMIWIDGHDLPMIRAFDSLFFESLDDTVAMPPAASAAGTSHIFKSADALAALAALPSSARSASDGRVLTFHDPASGESTLPTIACRMHQLEGNERTLMRRQTASSIYYVVRGQGSTQAGEERLRWEAGDIFVIPNWTWYQHEISARDAVLFSLTDEPMLAALGLLREQTEDARAGVSIATR